jgi:hypothetical protein
LAKEESADTGDNTSGSSSLSGSAIDLTLLDSQDVINNEVEMRAKAEINPDDLEFMASFEKLSSESYQVCDYGFTPITYWMDRLLFCQVQAQAKVPQFKSAIPSTVKEQLQPPTHPHKENDALFRVGLMTKKGQKQHVGQFK